MVLSDWQLFDDEYHLRQFKRPYRSTVKFCDFLEKHGVLGENYQQILDVGAGAGANVYYMARRFPDNFFVGLDINPRLIEIGKKRLRKLHNATMVLGNLYRLKKRFDGVVSYQTLSWLPECDDAIKSILSIKPRWIGLTSLFYDGLVEYRIQTIDHGKREARHYYNIYSLEHVKKLFNENGYKLVYEPFEIDIDLKKPDGKGLGTYTQKLEDGKRIQISGALLMPWYFILAKKKKAGV